MKREKTGLYFGLVGFSGFGGFQEKMLSELLNEEIQGRGGHVEDG